MDDLAAALVRLADAFPDDLEPAADSFDVDELFDIVIYYSHRPAGSNAADFARWMLSWTPRLLRLYLEGPTGFAWDVLPDRLVEAGWRRLAEWEDRLWGLWWPESQLTTPRNRPFR